jgi:glycosyltransferase involved in cell wall biosynthesis
LEPNANLNAGAARHIGTLNSEGIWILYLDGDMEISESFLPVLSELINSDKRNEGLCGFTQNIYPDGGRDLIKFKGNINGYNCSSFGGAVVLPRRAVLDSGNWSCELFSYEETELYSRLSLRISAVIWSDKIMVLHRTPRVTVPKKFLGGVLPFRSYLGKKYYGAGQVTLFSMRNGSFYSFFKMKPEPYFMYFSIMLALVTSPFFSWYSIKFVFVGLVINIFRVGMRGALNYAFWTPQILLGLWRLPRGFIPKIKTIRINSGHRSDNSAEGPR